MRWPHGLVSPVIEHTEYPEQASSAKRPIRALGWALCLSIVTCLNAPAHAQTPAAVQPPAGYTHAIEQAVESFRTRDFVRARELFGQAHALEPSARTLRGMGLSDFESGRYAVAISELESALNEPRKALDAQQRGEIQAVIAHARGFVGTLKVTVTPANATVTIDDTPASRDAMQLDSGLHTLRANALGYVDLEHEVRVLPGEVANVALTLDPITATNNTPDLGASQRTAAWVVAGVGAAGLIVGGVFGVRSIVKHNESDQYCGRDGLCGDRRGVVAMDAARVAGNVSTIAFIASGVALGVSTVLFLTAETDESQPPPSAAGARLSIGPGSVGLSGAF